MSKNSQIAKLNERGQSIWYDNLSRDVLNSGKLVELINSGVSGLTSNPTIFKVAIADSQDYDQRLLELKDSNLSTEQLCEELMLEDVAQAADLLKETYESTNGHDGYASVEVSPFLANDTEKTIEAARRIWNKLSRKNIMIKVPATKEGIPAIKQLLIDGFNVNITLIFSVEVYADVLEAYLSALETRLENSESIDKISSVASFFVSRVDSICEKKFDELVSDSKASEDDREKFFGKVGIANSKLAYKHFLEVSESERFSKLKSNGAMAQRPLWASTSTKNPSLSPLLYTEALAGADTVNTLPPSTLEELLKASDVKTALSEGLDESEQLINSLGSLDLDLDKYLVELQEAGVKSFSDSYQELLDAIEQKVNKI